jgi:hypothetical protein
MSFLSRKPIRWLSAAAILLLTSGGAYAQATRTWVSGVGDDANPCSRTAPCKTFAGAISKTAAGGEIDVLDPGGYGGVTITKSITLNAMDSEEAGILVAGTNGITVNCATDPACIVVLRGLNINGGPPSSNSPNGIRFIAGGALHVEKCHISQFTGPGPYGYGINFQPSVNTARLYVSDSVVDSNGAGSTGGGIIVNPTISAGLYAFATIENTYVSNNRGIGIEATDNGFIQIHNSNVSGSQLSGLAAWNTNATYFADIVVDGSVLNDNGWDQTIPQGSAYAAGTHAYIHMSNNVVSNNKYGIRVVASGHVLSFGNNRLTSNTTDGTFTGTQTQQ